jgi:ribosomal protein S18 acetylase RimI-like enzyme
MELRHITENDLDATYVLLAENGWTHRLGSVAEFRTLVAASQIATVATVNDEIVGFIRALTDRQSNGYLSMLVVSEKYRRQGIGRALVESVVGSHLPVTWILRAGREGAVTFFAKLGFEFSTIAMERRRL